MSERFHIIVTGESGRSISLQLSKKRFFLTASTVILALMIICISGYLTTGSYLTHKLLTQKVDDLQERLLQTRKANHDYAEQIAELDRKHAEKIAALTERQENLLAEQQMKFDLENTNLQLENFKLMSTAVSDLNERSKLIESVMGSIGVKIKQPKATAQTEGSGGPYIPFRETSYDGLMQRVDTYLDTIRTMPLGRPVKGSISSRFGKRTDPLNDKSAFHEGIDIKGEKGDRIRATASGKVIKALKNGGYGNYVEIDHGNGYVTAYGHMQNYLVKKGEFVEQGQVIGQVGSSGRSTGPHLHYEIRLNNKLINPAEFIKVAELSHTFTANRE